MKRWEARFFSELTGAEMHALLKLRQNVFIVEQKCIYPDIDVYDQHAMHVFLTDQKQDMVAYARLLDPGVRFHEPSVGRVAVALSERGNGIGRMLMEKTLEQSEYLYPMKSNRISAQMHLKDFYASFGYEQVSDEYDEDGIPHIEMLRPAPCSMSVSRLV